LQPNLNLIVSLAKSLKTKIFTIVNPGLTS